MLNLLTHQWRKFFIFWFHFIHSFKQHFLRMDTYSDTKPCPMPPTAYRETGKPTNGSLSIVIGLLTEKNKVLWEMDNLSRGPNFNGGLARFPLLHPLIYYGNHLLLSSHFSYEPNKILQRWTGIQIEPICYPLWILWVGPLVSHMVPSLTAGSLQLTDHSSA